MAQVTTIERLARPESRQNAQASLSDERDPVCGMMVDPATAKDRSEHAGHTSYFCGTGCRDRFEADPVPM